MLTLTLIFKNMMNCQTSIGKFPRTVLVSAILYYLLDEYFTQASKVPNHSLVGEILEAETIARMSEAHYAQITRHLFCGPIEGIALAGKQNLVPLEDAAKPDRFICYPQKVDLSIIHQLFTEG